MTPLDNFLASAPEMDRAAKKSHPHPLPSPIRFNPLLLSKNKF
jgi:hypothetical protein